MPEGGEGGGNHCELMGQSEEGSAVRSWEMEEGAPKGERGGRRREQRGGGRELGFGFLALVIYESMSLFSEADIFKVFVPKN